MPILLLFAFVPAILVIALAVMLISGSVMFLTNKNYFTKENIFYTGCRDVFNKVNDKAEDIKKVQQARKPKHVRTIDVVIFKERN